MLAFMRRLLATSVLALLALCALASAALAATPRPTVTSFSPAQVPIGGTLILKGKNFAKGASKNRVFFVRATDGKTVRARPKSASKTRITLKVPTTLDKFLTVDANGAKKATRFQVYIFTKVFGPKTKRSRSPIVLPAGAAPVPGGGGGTTTPGATAADCDADGTPNTTDNDDDNDLIGDDVEKKIGTDPCKPDTDGDGIEDGFEYYSALDLNGNALPYPGSRPYPNALDGSDAGTDFDGDGLKGSEEFAAWNLYGGRVLPAAAGQSFPYSDGNQTSTAPANVGAMDLDGNARITDDEKDADSDGLPNWVELAKTESAYSTSSGCAFVSSTGPAPTHYSNTFTSCDAGVTILPNGNTFGNAIVTGSTVNGTKPPAWLVTQLMNFLVSDTDGDGINDGQDDNDFDGISNLQEITAGTDGFYTEPQDPCDPDVNARACPLHA
jgi:hypothetical protein